MGGKKKGAKRNGDLDEKIQSYLPSLMKAKDRFVRNHIAHSLLWANNMANLDHVFKLIEDEKSRAERSSSPQEQEKDPQLSGEYEKDQIDYIKPSASSTQGELRKTNQDYALHMELDPPTKKVIKRRSRKEGQSPEITASIPAQQKDSLVSDPQVQFSFSKIKEGTAIIRNVLSFLEDRPLLLVFSAVSLEWLSISLDIVFKRFHPDSLSRDQLSTAMKKKYLLERFTLEHRISTCSLLRERNDDYQYAKQFI